jgi:hypothetical protein
VADDAREAPEEHDQPTPPSARRRHRARLSPIIAASIIAAALLGALLALWLSGEQLLGVLFPKTLDITKLEVDGEAYKSYFTVERKLAGPRGRTLILSLRRTKTFPLRDSDLETLAERADRAFSTLRVLQAVGDGYVRCEYFTKKGAFLGCTFGRIKDLAARETAELTLPVADYPGVQRVVLTY